MIKNQLEFEFDQKLGYGDYWEAKELYDAVGMGYKNSGDGTPEGWKYLGSGGSRAAYLSPTGICYKVCHEYPPEDESLNDVEHKNFERIAREGKLPPKWRVPKSHLHVFEGTVRRWDYHMRERKTKPVRIAILACEYVPGEVLSYTADRETRVAVEKAFFAVGLSDTGGANAVRQGDGTHYIIDAAEWMAPEDKSEVRPMVVPTFNDDF